MFAPSLLPMDLSLVVAQQWPAPSGRQPAGSAGGFLWVLLGVLGMLACSLTELFRLYLWLFCSNVRKIDKAVQVDIPACDMETVMTLTVESIKADLARFQASKAGTTESLAERLCEFGKRSLLAN